MSSTTTKRSLDRARVSNSYGAGGSPIGETTAPPPNPGEQRSRVGERLVDDAVDRARLRSMVKRGDGERIPDELVDELLAGARTEEEIVGPGGLLAELTRRLVERAMEVELTEHLGYEHHAEPPGGAGNTRNGTTPKTLVTEHGPVRIKRPATATAALIRRSCASASGALRGRSYRCQVRLRVIPKPGVPQMIVVVTAGCQVECRRGRRVGCCRARGRCSA